MWMVLRFMALTLYGLYTQLNLVTSSSCALHAGFTCLVFYSNISRSILVRFDANMLSHLSILLM